MADRRVEYELWLVQDNNKDTVTEWKSILGLTNSISGLGPGSVWSDVTDVADALFLQVIPQS